MTLGGGLDDTPSPASHDSRAPEVRKFECSGLAARPALAACTLHTGLLRSARGCEALYGASGADLVSEERKREQRATFPIINKAATPSILMRQGGKNQRPGSRYTIGHNRDPAFFFKKRQERETERKEKAVQKAVPHVHLHALRGRCRRSYLKECGGCGGPGGTLGPSGAGRAGPTSPADSQEVGGSGTLPSKSLCFLGAVWPRARVKISGLGTQDRICSMAARKDSFPFSVSSSPPPSPTAMFRQRLL